jgi:hypothetical protein
MGEEIIAALTEKDKRERMAPLPQFGLQCGASLEMEKGGEAPDPAFSPSKSVARLSGLDWVV